MVPSRWNGAKLAAMPEADVVVKVGGSLLGLADLAARLERFLESLGDSRPILICGGGGAVDILRKLDPIYELDESDWHWLALRTLTVNTELLAKLLPNARSVSTQRELQAALADGKAPVYDSYEFVKRIDTQQRAPLPRQWRVTSDSIAARMADVFGANELILLKSTDFPPGYGLQQAADAELVDAFFPTAAAEIERVSVVNLRGSDERVTLG